MKKGFTLAEVLIVLMTIAIIATLTIPSIIQGIKDIQYKTSYKKAYNTIYNIIAIQSLKGEISKYYAPDMEGNLYCDSSEIFQMLNNYLEIKDYACVENRITTESKDLVSNKNQKPSYSTTIPKVCAGSIWINTQDNIAYTINCGDCIQPNNCRKNNINAQNNYENTLQNSVFVVEIDVNGLDKEPNMVEAQIKESLDENKKMKLLTGDRFYIYIGTDGISAGNKTKSVTGRIIAGIK